MARVDDMPGQPAGEHRMKRRSGTRIAKLVTLGPAAAFTVRRGWVQRSGRRARFARSLR